MNLTATAAGNCPALTQMALRGASDPPRSHNFPLFLPSFQQPHLARLFVALL